MRAAYHQENTRRRCCFRSTWTRRSLTNALRQGVDVEGVNKEPLAATVATRAPESPEADDRDPSFLWNCVVQGLGTELWRVF